MQTEKKIKSASNRNTFNQNKFQLCPDCEIMECITNDNFSDLRYGSATEGNKLDEMNNFEIFGLQS